MGVRLNTAKILFAASLLSCASISAASGITVPAGATLNLAGGQIAAAGGDLITGGMLQLTTGNVVNLRNFQVSAGGQAALGSGQIDLFGDWTNAGVIDPGSSLVRFVDNTLASSGILGASTFASVSFISASGKRYLFQSGQTQTVNTALTIQGTQAMPIQFDVTSPGSIANINLLPTGTQTIQYVGVSDVHATGQHLAPNQVNDGGRGNDSGWFRALMAPYTAVPGLTPWSMMMMLLALGVLAWSQIRRRQNNTFHAAPNNSLEV